MKKVLVFLSLAPVLLLAGLRPRNVVAELGTATWCGYCPQAYAGLEVMKGQYPVPDLVCVRYYASSGDYGTAEIDSRISYYGISGFPTAVFNGTESVVGGGSTTADGSRYDPVVSGLLSLATPFGVNVTMNIASNKATVTTKVKLYGDYSGTTPKLIVALTEDEVTSEYTNLTRRVVTAGDVTITGEGQEQTIEQQFDLDASWNKTKLHAVAFVQLSTTKEVLQAGSNYPTPDYHYRFTAPSRVARLAPSGTMTSSFYLTNAGSKADNFNVTLDKSKLPSGWTANLVAPTIAATSLDPDESAEFTVEIKPNGHTGQGDVTVKVSSSSGGENQEMVFRGITNDVDINVVDDDGGENYETYTTAALDAIGKTYGVWDVGMGAFDLSNVAADKTPVLIWSCGWSFPSLSPTDRTFIKYYLDKGGKLFISGQDIGWDLNDGNSSDATYDAQQFYANYLHAKYVADSAASIAVTGVAGDPISAGLSFNIAGGDGANNQVYPDAVDPADASATSFLKYGTSQSAGIRVQKDNYKVVYLGFGFEGIANAASRKSLLEKALAWLGTAAPLGVSEDARPAIVTPFLKVSTVSGGVFAVSFNMPSQTGRLEIFDVLGRKVIQTTLTTQLGRTTLDMTGHPAGCYFARISSAGYSSGAKFVVVH